MKLTRKIIINRSNGQGSMTLPKKVLEQLKIESKNNKYPKKIKIEILNPKKIRGKKDGNYF